MAPVPTGTHAGATEPPMPATTAPASCTATWSTRCDCRECRYERAQVRDQRLTAAALRELCWLARERRA